MTTAPGIGCVSARAILQTATATNVAGSAQDSIRREPVTWDIEGEAVSRNRPRYVCSPDEIAQVAPEMESM